jgi:hypothetical protein
MSSSDSSVRLLFSDVRLRFELELEFVSLLANPFYLQSLAQSRLLDRPDLLGYLSYLQYWKLSSYSIFVTHPHSLLFLDLLQDEGFRSRLLDPNFINLLHTQQFWHWRSFRYNRYLDKIKGSENYSEPEMTAELSETARRKVENEKE